MNVIDMGVGDPVIPTDKTIIKGLDMGLGMDEAFRYPSYNGERFYREAVHEYLSNRFNVELDVDSEITLLIGSKEGIAHLPFALLDPGDKAAYTEPGYPVYRSAIAFAGGEPLSIPLRPENGFVPDLDDIPAGIKLLFINYPNNPTSARVDKEWLTNLVHHAREHGYIIANDAAYVEIYENDPPPSILEIDGAMDCVVEFHSLSKPFAMTGWRLAFAAGNPDVIRYLGIVKKQIDSGQFKPMQRAGAAALRSPEIIENVRNIYRKRKSTFRAALEASPFFRSVHPSDATLYLWADIGGNSAEFAARLLREKGIVCLPGVFTGPSGEGFVRFSMTLPDEDVERAVARLRE